MIKSVIIAAGGTGGHIYPGLAVGKSLEKLGIKVDWIGTKTGMENKILEGLDFKLYTINVKGLRKSGVLRMIGAPFVLVFSVCQAISIILRVNPQVVIGMGGFVSGPAGIAAKLCRRKLVIHEQNAVAGITNRVLSLLANRTLQAFPDTFKGNVKAITTGNPVRDSISSIPPPEVRTGQKNNVSILVFGGSRGAGILNDVIPQGIVNSGLRHLSVLHQCGERNESRTEIAYSKVDSSCEIEVVAFIEQMNFAYKDADLVIARAGAITVAEIAAVGVASILVPYAYAVDDHQTKNAEFLHRAGAALIIKEEQLSPSSIADAIRKLLFRPDKLIDMAKAARRLGSKNSLSLVVDNCIRF